MYQQPGDPNAQNQGSYYPPSSPQWPNTSPGYTPSGSPSGTDQSSYAPPPPTPTPTYYPPTQLGAPPYNPQGGYPGGPGYVPPTPPRKSNTRMIVIIAAVLIGILVIGGAGVVLGRQAGPKTTTTPTPATGTTPSTSGSTPASGNTPTTGDTPVSGTTPTSVTSTSDAKVGQVVQAGPNYAVTVNSVKTSTGDDFSQPKTGNIYIVIDVTVKNTSSSLQDVSSFINFELQDTTGQKYDTAFTDIGTPPDQTGLQPGKLIRGQLVYEVPSSLHQFTFSYLDFLANGTLATWDLTD